MFKFIQSIQELFAPKPALLTLDNIVNEEKLFTQKNNLHKKNVATKQLDKAMSFFHAELKKKNFEPVAITFDKLSTLFQYTPDSLVDVCVSLLHPEDVNQKHGMLRFDICEIKQKSAFSDFLEMLHKRFNIKLLHVIYGNTDKYSLEFTFKPEHDF